MEELSQFYDDNLDDPKITFFEKLRLKLKKALHHRVGDTQVEFRDMRTNKKNFKDDLLAIEKNVFNQSLL